MMRFTLILAMAMGVAATAQQPLPLTKADCAKKKNKDCEFQQPAPAATKPQDALPGGDADVPGEEPSPKAAPPSAPPSSSSSGGNSPAGKSGSGMQGGDADPPADSMKPHPELLDKDPDAPAKKDDASGFSSSSDPNRSSDPQANDAPAPTTQDGDTPVKAAPLQNLGAKRDSSAIHEKLDQTRVKDDLKVANFYMKDGNWQGAYLRFKDAVEHDASEDDAQYGLAQAAEKLQKVDEAKAHYAEYLKAFPDGDHAKDAASALNRLYGGSKK